MKAVLPIKSPIQIQNTVYLTVLIDNKGYNIFSSHTWN